MGRSGGTEMLDDFYPRPPRGGRPEIGDGTDKVIDISIHALREEGDGGNFFAHRVYHISIHALREEGDLIAIGISAGSQYFYPRPPRGGRPHDVMARFCVQHFYPRPPRGGRRHPACDD